MATGLSVTIPTSAQAHGKFGRVWAKGNYLHGASWDATFEADHDDTTNFESQGWQEISFGIFRVNGSIELIARTDEEIFSAELGLIPGSYIAMALFDRALHWYAGTAGILSANPKVAVNGAVKYTVRWMSSGVWAFPTQVQESFPGLAS